MKFHCKIIFILFLISIKSYAIHSIPNDCYRHKIENCLVDSQNNYLLIDFESAEISLSKETQIEIKDNKLTIIKGIVFVQKNNSMTMRVGTSEAEFQILDHGGVLIERSQNKTTISNINVKKIQILNKSNTKIEVLTPLLTNWYAGYDDKGECFKGVMSVYKKQDMVQHLSRLPYGNKLERQEQIEFITENQSKVIEATSEIIKEGFERQIAQENAKENSSSEKKIETEQEQLRKLFRAKNNLE